MLSYRWERDKMDGVNEQKIEKYKKMLCSMFRVRNIEMLDMITKNRESLVNMDLQNRKITQQEADILKDYIRELSEQVKRAWETKNIKKQEELDKKVAENMAIFHKRLEARNALPEEKKNVDNNVIQYRDILGKGTLREHSEGMEL